LQAALLFEKQQANLNKVNANEPPLSTKELQVKEKANIN